MSFASSRLCCTIYAEADRRVAMGMIRAAADNASSMKDIGLRGVRRDAGLPGDRTLAAEGQCHDPKIDPIVEFDQAPDSSRSRGYGRYEI
jgi:hypothetical protein